MQISRVRPGNQREGAGREGGGEMVAGKEGGGGREGRKPSEAG